MTLHIPPQRDPAARIALLVLVGVVCAALYMTAAQPQPASAQIIILDATPTPALPAPALALTDQTGAIVAIPTPAIPEPPTAGPGWIDQALAGAAATADQFANDQAAALAEEQAAAAAKAAADHAQYLANIGAQAPHSPRGDVVNPPAFVPGMVAQPVNADNEIIIINPQPAADPLAGIAAAVPALSQEQAAILTERQSNGCAAGQVFYPRTGCHTPGSGGPQPGAVGAP